MSYIEPIVVDSDFSTNYDAKAWIYTTLNNISYAKIAFYAGEINPEIWALGTGITEIHRLEKIEEGEFSTDSLSTSGSFNNILMFNEEDELLATRYIRTPISLSATRSLTVTVECYDKTETLIKDSYQIDFTNHIDNAYENGVEKEHPKIFDEDSEIASKDYIKPKHDQFMQENKSILQLVNEFDPILGKLQVKQGVPTLSAGEGRRYSYFLWYYWDVDSIQNKIRDKLNDDTWEMKNRPYLGFNDRYGSFLYYYEFTKDYIILVMAGSNNYNFIDIFIVNNTFGLTQSDDLPNYRIKFNRFYDRIYFVNNNDCYCFYPIEIEGKESPEVIKLKEPTDAGYMYYDMNIYSMSDLEFVQLSTGHTTYICEFSDLGDVLIDVNSDRYKFMNIFGEESIGKLEPEILNTYMIDDRPNKKVLISMYETSAIAIKYLLDNNYKIVYVGSEYTVGYSNEYDNYLIIFKLPHYCDRRRVKLSGLDSFSGSYLLFKDGHVESIYGLTLDNGEDYFGCKFSEGLLAVDRGVIVKMSEKYKGAYRVTN